MRLYRTVITIVNYDCKTVIVQGYRPLGGIHKTIYETLTIIICVGVPYHNIDQDVLA
jgi:hypothetical protein